MISFDEVAIARAARVLAGRISAGCSDWLASARAVLDAACRPGADPTGQKTLTESVPAASLWCRIGQRFGPG